MASLEAACTIRLELSALHENETPNIMHQKGKQTQNDIYEEENLMNTSEEQTQSDMFKELIGAQCEKDEKDESISELFLNRGTLDDNSGIREWDIVLKLDGSALNQINNDASPSSLPAKVYPARYRIPNAILEQQSSNKEKVQRAEIFALGCLLYKVLSGKEMFAGIGSGEKEDELIQAYFIKGHFPKDVWELSQVMRILGCWCPRFAKYLLAARNSDEDYRSKMANYMANYIKQHPVRFGFQVVGSLATIAAFFRSPVLVGIGFGAAGPVAGSFAPGWQSSIGLVEAGSLFAWCQSAATGGAAVGGILATGLAGAGVAVGATVAGALDNVDATEPDLKEKFLAAWRLNIGETAKANAKL